jgi:hypothetical protein
VHEFAQRVYASGWTVLGGVLAVPCNPQSALAGLNPLPRGPGPEVSAPSRGVDGSVPRRWRPVNQVRSGRKQP